MNAPFFSRLERWARKATTRRRPTCQLEVEDLEKRLTPTLLIVAPAGAVVGAHHYATLAQALGAAQNGDTIEIEPGAKLSASATTIGTVYQNNLTIEGVPSAGAIGLQAAGTLINNLVIIGNDDVITNVAVGTVAIGLGNTGETFSNDIFFGEGVIQTMGIGSSGLVNGYDTVTGSTFNNGADVTLGNMPGSTYDTASNDTISNNLFLNPIGLAINVSNETGGLVITGNRIYHDDPATGGNFITATDCTGVISGNTLQLDAAAGSVGILATDYNFVDGQSTFLSIANNVITTNGTAIGIIHQSTYNDFTVSVTDNTLAGSLVGLAVQGNGADGGSDFGNVVATGNDFRSFTGKNGNYAIEATDYQFTFLNATSNASTITATGNIFSVTSAQTVVSTAEAPGATITTSVPLTGTKATITAMFETLAGGAPTAAQITADSKLTGTALAKAAVTSTQAMSAWVESLSVALWGRMLTAAELKTYTNDLTSGAWNEEQAIVAFVTTAEYYNKVTQGASNPNGAWVQSLYLNLLGRQATGAQLSAALTYIKKYGLASYATTVVDSTEFRTDQIQAYYGMGVIGVIPAPNILKGAVTLTTAELNALVNSKSDLFSIQELLLGDTNFQSLG
jgi:hypothetical protein